MYKRQGVTVDVLSVMLFINDAVVRGRVFDVNLLSVLLFELLDVDVGVDVDYG